jgi:hypothetical protein
MKHKVSELEGALLNAAVAKAEGIEYRLRQTTQWDLDCERLRGDGLYDYYSPSGFWETGGPIIEREHIDIMYGSGESYAPWCAGMPLETWRVESGITIIGRTPLEAAMRAYVASKFGEEVELP